MTGRRLAIPYKAGMAKIEMADPPVDQSTSGPEEDTIDVLDVLILMARRRRFLVIGTIVGLLVGLALALILRPTFTATAIIMPPQQQQSTASALAGQLGALAGLGGGAASLGLKNPAEMYVGILESQTIADEIIQKFHLQSVYETKKLVDTRTALKNHSKIDAGKDGLIDIAIKDHDPRRASAIANAYIDELYKMNSRLAISEAAQRRVFFDQQLNEERTALDKAETDLRNTEEKTGVIQLSGQAEAIIRSIAETRADIASLEVQLQATNTFATSQNPDAIRLQQEIATMRGQLANLENNQKKITPGDIQVPAGRVPEASLQYLQKLRELKYHETLFDLLSKQYEAARMDEAKSAPIIQVIDRAIPPDKKSGPPRTLLTVGFAFVGFCLACLWVFIKSGLDRMEQDPERSEKLHRLRAALRK